MILKLRMPPVLLGMTRRFSGGVIPLPYEGFAFFVGESFARSYNGVFFPGMKRGHLLRRGEEAGKANTQKVIFCVPFFLHLYLITGFPKNLPNIFPTF